MRINIPDNKINNFELRKITEIFKKQNIHLDKNFDIFKDPEELFTFYIIDEINNKGYIIYLDCDYIEEKDVNKIKFIKKGL